MRGVNAIKEYFKSKLGSEGLLNIIKAAPDKSKSTKDVTEGKQAEAKK